MTISPAHPSDYADAFAWLYGWSPEDRDAAMSHVFRQIAKEELKPEHLLVAKLDDQLTGVVFCQSLAGGVAVLVPPRTIANSAAIADRLLAGAIERVPEAKVVQAFVEETDFASSDCLRRGGFRRVTSVLQMRQETRGEAANQSRRPELRPFADVDPRAFANVLMECLEHSQDCPELHRLLSKDDVLAGYNASSPDQTRWFLAVTGDLPIGVLIVGDGELGFVGVLPKWRGRGYGTQLVQAACEMSPGLSLIVDERNSQAIRLYARLGFCQNSRRGVYLFSHSDSAGGSRAKMEST